LLSFRVCLDKKRNLKGKKIEGKNVKGKKVDGKLVESEMIFRLFDLSESEKKVRGKKDV
jgi:hypothetical protein